MNVSLRGNSLKTINRKSKKISPCNSLILKKPAIDIFFAGSSPAWEKLNLKDKVAHNLKNANKCDMVMNTLGALSGVVIAVSIGPAGAFVLPLIALSTCLALSPVLKAVFNKEISPKNQS